MPVRLTRSRRKAAWKPSPKLAKFLAAIRAAAQQLMTEYGEVADNAAIALIAVQQEQ